MRTYPISIIIPVYKNFEVFFKYFDSNKKYFDDCEVIIMNDDPSKNITKEIEKIYPDAIVVNNEKNLGFAGNVNQGVLKSSGDYIFLMNSDVALLDNSFLKALRYFETDNNLFAVGFAQIEKDGRTVGANRAYFKNGLINHSSLHPTPYSLHPIFWAEGGSSLFNKDLFIKLGMFDELFNPFYWEDIDLCFRAWKAGYKVAYDPSVKVEHHHETTISKYFDKAMITKTAFRNQLIFHWKNLTDSNLIINHIINIPRLIFIPGFFDALIQLPKILKVRKKTVKLFIKSDQEILNLFG